MQLKKGTPVIITVYDTPCRGIISSSHHPTGVYRVEIGVGPIKYEFIRDHDEITVDKQAVLKNYFQ
jgi:hypothetical protein